MQNLSTVIHFHFVDLGNASFLTSLKLAGGPIGTVAEGPIGTVAGGPYCNGSFCYHLDQSAVSQLAEEATIPMNPRRNVCPNPFCFK